MTIGGDWKYVAGDHWCICDRCGFKVRFSDTRKEWNGLRVCTKDYEARQPQDFVRSVKDRQKVEDARPRDTDIFIDLGLLVNNDGLTIIGGGQAPFKVS